jgi:hypothetical protein
MACVACVDIYIWCIISSVCSTQLMTNATSYVKWAWNSTEDYWKPKHLWTRCVYMARISGFPRDQWNKCMQSCMHTCMHVVDGLMMIDWWCVNTGFYLFSNLAIFHLLSLLSLPLYRLDPNMMPAARNGSVHLFNVMEKCSHIVGNLDLIRFLDSNNEHLIRYVYMIIVVNQLYFNA